MTPDGNGASRRVRGDERGAHRAVRKQSALRRTVVVGGAAACIGVAFELAPTAEALSVVFPGFDRNGNASSVQINIFEGNIFNPQLGINKSNVSNNSLIGSAINGLGGGLFSNLPGSYKRPFVIGGAAGNGNTTQVNIFSFNIVNPQVAFGGSNTSHNTTINNVVANSGNDVKTPSAGGGSVFGPMVGNGNAIQLAFFSGNIFNPQWSLGGQNISNNLAATNIFMLNGNGSQAGGAGNPMLSFLNGNGNVFQGAGFVSNIFNPQISSGNGNSSNNWATTNNSSGNGNGSGTGTTGGGVVVGSTGNGNATQTASGSSNIYNDQWNFGIASIGRPAVDTSTTRQAPALAADEDPELLIEEGTGTTASKSGVSTTRPNNPLRTVVRNLQQTAKTVVAAITPKKPGSASTPGTAAATAPDAPASPPKDDEGNADNDGQDK